MRSKVDRKGVVRLIVEVEVHLDGPVYEDEPADGDWDEDVASMVSEAKLTFESYGKVRSVELEVLERPQTIAELLTEGKGPVH